MSNSDTTPFLGAYLIVRDAEQTLPSLLDSIDGAFDELVIVDTGSVDGTVALIQQARDTRSTLPIQFFTFTWCDDFSAARQFAFEKGTATWRGYLDADDVLPNAKKLRPTLKMIAERDPRANALSMVYNYTQDGTCPQDVNRFVRWADGWKWQDEIHEHLVRTNGPKVIAKTDLIVHHVRAAGQAQKSLARNKVICKAILARATANGDRRKQGMMSYYLGLYASHDEQFVTAAGYLISAKNNLQFTNISCYALCELARLSIRNGELSDALTYAGQALAAAPELPDGYATMGIVLTMVEAYERAILVFERLATLPRPQLETVRDVAWNDGLSWAWAGRAYLRTGRVDAAHDCLIKACQYRQDPRVAPMIREVMVEVMQAKGLIAFKTLLDFYLWSAEPMRAKDLFTLAPHSISDLPQLGAMKAQLLAKLTHLHGWDEYQAAYASIPASTYHTPEGKLAEPLQYGRARAVREWAEGLPKEGPALHVLSIGSQDGIIERPVLEANSRIHLTVCDVAPQAGPKLLQLMSDFPGRVSIHRVVDHHYDWFPGEQHFDAVFLFEVLEHLPSDVGALSDISSRLKEDGTLFLSTPVASRWIEPYLTDPRLGPSWYAHVRGYNPTSLRHVLRALGYSGNIFATENNGGVFLAIMKSVGDTTRLDTGIAILVSMGAPFDPQSLQEGHLGGSEEAVVHLARALAIYGYKVTVYAPRPARDPEIHVLHDVLWRSNTEFDPLGDHDHILVWRQPALAAQLKAQLKDAQHTKKVWNWAHDTHYGAPKEAYDAVDGTIVLSDAHRSILMDLDKVDGSKIFHAQNGIDPREFPELDDAIESARDLHKVIYASSPDRGLIDLLRMWPDVWREVPDATLDIYYSWDGFKARIDRDFSFAKEHGPLLAELEAKLEQLRSWGVTYHGGVSHPVLHNAYRRSSIWAYPTNFYEISCISLMKAQACGTFPIYFNYGALCETGLRDTTILPGYYNAFQRELIQLLKHPPSLSERRTMRERVINEYSWEVAAAMFAEVFE